MMTSALRLLCSPVPLPGVTQACRWGSSLPIATKSYCISQTVALSQGVWLPLLLGFLAWVLGGGLGGDVFPSLPHALLRLMDCVPSPLQAMTQVLSRLSLPPRPSGGWGSAGQLLAHVTASLFGSV